MGIPYRTLLPKDGKNVLIAPSGEFHNEREIGDVSLGVTKQGSPLYLRDVSDIVRSYDSPARFLNFYSWFKDVTGCAESREEIIPGSTLGELRSELGRKFPKFGQAEKSTLMAVGLDYQDGSYVLKENDEVSFFPPVQGG